MPTNSLAKKMKLQPGQRAAVVNAPEGYVKELRPLPARVDLVERLQGKFDWVNDTWSALALRPYKPGEARQSFR